MGSQRQNSNMGRHRHAISLVPVVAVKNTVN